MDKKTYNLYRLLRFIKREKLISRTQITRKVLGRRIYTNMTDLNEAVDYLVNARWVNWEHKYIPGREGGPKPMVFYITPSGKSWLRSMEKKRDRMLKRLEG